MNTLHDRARAEIDALKAELALEHDVPRDAAFDEAWRMAWDAGHGSGLSEVRIYFDDFINLVKIARK